MEEKKEQLIIEKGDGMGWTLNFRNKWSYPVLIIMLLAITVMIVYNIWPHKK